MLRRIGLVPERSESRAVAQCCRALRALQPGKRARYFQALASRSLTIPDWTPEDLVYETEVLEASSWPHLPPRCVPDEDQAEAAHRSLASDAGLGIDGRMVTLSLDCSSLLCYTTELAAACSSEEESDLPRAKLERARPSLESFRFALEHSLVQGRTTPVSVLFFT